MTTHNFQIYLNQLIDNLRTKGITDERVLNAMKKVPRHIFVPKEYQNQAYHDYPVPIEEGQTISQPYTVAFMTQLLEVKPGEKILEIGTGSGYQAAILAQLGAEVYTVERIKSLFESATQRLKTLGYDNIHTFFADGTMGLPQFAPFDKIIVTAAGELQQNLLEQLKINGILVAPIDDNLWGSTMYKIIKLDSDSYRTFKYPGFSFVPLLKGTVE